MRKLPLFRIRQPLRIFRITSRCQPEDVTCSHTGFQGGFYGFCWCQACRLPLPLPRGFLQPGGARVPSTRLGRERSSPRTGACPCPGHANKNVTSSPKAVMVVPSDDSKGLFNVGVLSSPSLTGGRNSRLVSVHGCKGWRDGQKPPGAGASRDKDCAGQTKGFSRQRSVELPGRTQRVRRQPTSQRGDTGAPSSQAPKRGKQELPSRSRGILDLEVRVSRKRHHSPLPLS